MIYDVFHYLGKEVVTLPFQPRVLQKYQNYISFWWCNGKLEGGERKTAFSLTLAAFPPLQSQGNFTGTSWHTMSQLHWANRAVFRPISGTKGVTVWGYVVGKWQFSRQHHSEQNHMSKPCFISCYFCWYVRLLVLICKAADRRESYDL